LYELFRLNRRHRLKRGFPGVPFEAVPSIYNKYYEIIINIINVPRGTFSTVK